MNNSLVQSLIIAIAAVGAAWFLIIRPLRLLTVDLPRLLHEYLREWQRLNHNIDLYNHQMAALYVEIRKLQEEGIMLRRRPKVAPLPFLTEDDNEEKDAFEEEEETDSGLKQ